MTVRDVLITGIGLVSSLGEGVDAHWAGFASDAAPALDAERFRPYVVHPLPEIDWSLQIPRRGDQRQMETWQRLGTYCAGLALDDAGLKGDEALCAGMDMIVAAGGGERDVAVDTAILEAAVDGADTGEIINRILTTELRPTLFLAQLSNLLAGNISIVHKVTGSSRTFMGEEGAGIAAVETAAARIRAGQSSHALVGAAFQTEHPDMLLAYQLGGHVHRDAWRPVWERTDAQGGGVVTGSGAAYLVLESEEHAAARGARAYARLDRVRSARLPRRDGYAEALERFVCEGVADAAGLLVTGASGAHAPTAAERAVLEKHPRLLARALSSRVGHLKEAQFPFAIALAALSVARGGAPAPMGSAERTGGDPAGGAAALTVGYVGGEGIARLAPAGRSA